MKLVLPDNEGVRRCSSHGILGGFRYCLCLRRTSPQVSVLFAPTTATCPIRLSQYTFLLYLLYQMCRTTARVAHPAKPPALMAEMAFAGEDHSKGVAICHTDGLFVADRATGLDNGRHACFGRRLDTISEGEVGI